MLIKATNESGYEFLPSYKEAKSFNKSFSNTVQVEGYWTFKKYDDVPDYMIKDVVFYGVTQPHTKEFKYKSAYLFDLGLCISVETGDFVDYKNITVDSWRTFTGRNSYFECNHLPQLLYPFMGGRISSIYGEYDLESDLFLGFIGITNDLD